MINTPKRPTRWLSIAAAIILIPLIGAEPATQPSTDSPCFHGGGALTGQAAPIPAPPMKARWTYIANAKDKAGIEGAPAIVGDTVYIADNKGTVHAIDLATGKNKWKYETDESFETAPLVMDGRVFVGDLTGNLHAIAADTGRKLWIYEGGAGIHASAAGVDGKVIFGNDGADVVCLDAAGMFVVTARRFGLGGIRIDRTAKELWKAEAGDRVNSCPAIANGMALVSGCDAQLRGFDLKTGNEKLTVPLEALTGGSPCVLPDCIIVGTDEGRVVCLPLDGKKPLWVYTDVEDKAMVYASPAAADGIAVVGARDQNIHAIDIATGKRKWVFQTKGDVDCSAMISDGRVYVGSRDKKLYVLNLKTGEKIWEFSAGKSISASVAIGRGVVVVADSGGNVYCLEPVKP